MSDYVLVYVCITGNLHSEYLPDLEKVTTRVKEVLITKFVSASNWRVYGTDDDGNICDIPIEL